MSAAIQAGSHVFLHYTLSFPDGQFIEGTENGAPVAVTIGSGDLAPFLEQCLLGLLAGERKRFEIIAEDTQSVRDRETVQTMARSDFPPEMPLAPGMVVEFQTPNGEAVPGVVTEISEAGVTVDFSHPLAGRDLVFEVEIISVENVPA